jgi:transposase InsO family protein
MDFQAAKIAIFKYIEGWYNRKSIHGSIGCKTPEQYEMLARKTA